MSYVSFAFMPALANLTYIPSAVSTYPLPKLDETRYKLPGPACNRLRRIRYAKYI